MSYPLLTSTKIIFGENFISQFSVLSNNASISGSVAIDNNADFSAGGYLQYNSNIKYLPSWTIAIDCNFVSAASDRVLLSVGDSVAGTNFEIGINSSDQMYITGTTTVASNDSLSEGIASLLYVYDGSNIEFWYNGVRVGKSEITLNDIDVLKMFVGIAADESSRPLGATIITSLKVYKYAFDENSSFDFSDVTSWTPKNLLSTYGGSYANGFYFDGDNAGSYTLNTQPNADTFDWDMSSGGTTAWINYNDPTSKEKLSPAPNGANYLRVTHTSGTSSWGVTQNALISGNRYRLNKTFFRGTASMQVYVGGGMNLYPYTALTANWTKAEVADSTVSGTVLYINSQGSAAGTYFDVSPMSIENTSATALNYYSSGGFASTKFSQTTATLMPWKNIDNHGVRFNGIEDCIQTTAPVAEQKFLHDGSEWMAGIIFTQDSAPALFSNLFSTSSGGSTTTGVYVWTRNTNQISVGIRNGLTSTNILSASSASGVITVGQPNVLTLYHSNGHLIVRANGVDIIDATPTAAYPTGDPSTMLSLGCIYSVNYFNGVIKKLCIVEGYNATDFARMEDYLMRSV